MKRLRDVLLGVVVGAGLAAGVVHAAANCSYIGGPMGLCQLATLAQSMLDLGYADTVPVARVVVGAPERAGVVVGQTITWMKPEPAIMVARGVWRRVPDGTPGAQSVVFIR